jgi:hypothetical protein
MVSTVVYMVGRSQRNGRWRRRRLRIRRARGVGLIWTLRRMMR